MSRVIVLDTGPLGLVTQRKGVPAADACRRWIAECLDRGALVIVPAIADFEVRRELLRAKKTQGLLRLDAFSSAEPDRYLFLSDAAIKLAAELWARSRQQGTPTADPKELDADVILAAQALTMEAAPADIVIATTNVGHLAQFVTADTWANIVS